MSNGLASIDATEPRHAPEAFGMVMSLLWLVTLRVLPVWRYRAGPGEVAALMHALRGLVAEAWLLRREGETDAALDRLLPHALAVRDALLALTAEAREADRWRRRVAVRPARRPRRTLRPARATHRRPALRVAFPRPILRARDGPPLAA